MPPILHLLAQMDADKLRTVSAGAPTLNDAPSYGMAWVIALLLTVLVVLVTFKPSKRNQTDRD